MRKHDQGFTLVEAMIAIVIFMVGLVAVAQLWTVAASSNQTANRATAATAVASQTMERLMAQPFGTLANSPPGGVDEEIPGVGNVNTVWQVNAMGAGMVSIQVTSEVEGLFQRLSRVEFVTYRIQSEALPAGGGGAAGGGGPAGGGGGV